MSNAMLKMFVGAHVGLYRMTGGKFGGAMRGGKVLLLSTTGRKTGKERTVPVMYIEDDKGHPVVTASFGGAPKHPAWFTNIESNPTVSYQIGDRKVQARAEVLPGPERDKMWQTLTSKYPGFAEYQTKTSRVIPMVALRPS
jgi:deazaflavin-dependent oxidoreductase (nitroreductase family)